MSDLIKSVTEGVIDQVKNTKEKSSGNALGKDAFMQLLVTQMKYQDPLNPNTDTQFIAQLATFSQLEQMQNISKVTTNSQAFSLVGKEVIIKTESETGTINYINGRVDFVNMSGGEAQLSIAGKLYSMDQLDTVVDEMYIFEKGLPGIKAKINLEYDGENTKDLSFEVSLGENETKADQVAVIVNNNLIPAEFVKIKDSKVIIDKAALKDLPTGVFKVTVVFNDPYVTTVKDMVSLQVKNGAVIEPEQDEEPEDIPEDNPEGNPEDDLEVI